MGSRRGLSLPQVSAYHVAANGWAFAPLHSPALALALMHDLKVACGAFSAVSAPAGQLKKTSHLVTIEPSKRLSAVSSAGSEDVHSMLAAGRLNKAVQLVRQTGRHRRHGRHARQGYIYSVAALLGLLVCCDICL